MPNRFRVVEEGRRLSVKFIESGGDRLINQLQKPTHFVKTAMHIEAPQKASIMTMTETMYWKYKNTNNNQLHQ